MGDDLLFPTGATTDENPRSKPFVYWTLIGGGAFVAVLGAALGIAALTQSHALATVTRQGPCVNSSSAGLVCTERVTYVAHDGRRYSAVMTGVHPDEVHGPPSHRTLAITYTSGSENSPTTDDMPNWVPIGLLVMGLALFGWGFSLRWRASHPRDRDHPAPAHIVHQSDSTHH